MPIRSIGLWLLTQVTRQSKSDASQSGAQIRLYRQLPVEGVILDAFHRQGEMVNGPTASMPFFEKAELKPENVRLRQPIVIV
jgi:hypothetical protein